LSKVRESTPVPVESLDSYDDLMRSIADCRHQAWMETVRASRARLAMIVDDLYEYEKERRAA
jgi:hypothetical protein